MSVGIVDRAPSVAPVAAASITSITGTGNLSGSATNSDIEPSTRTETSGSVEFNSRDSGTPIPPLPTGSPAWIGNGGAYGPRESGGAAASSVVVVAVPPTLVVVGDEGMVVVDDNGGEAVVVDARVVVVDDGGDVVAVDDGGLDVVVVVVGGVVVDVVVVVGSGKLAETWTLSK
jgi:hypothetical protein